MSLFAKIMVVVNLVLAVVFLAAVGTLHGASESWKKKHDDKTAELSGKISNLESQVKARDGELTTARSNVEASNTKAAAAEAVQKQLQDSNAALSAENANHKGEKEKLLANVGELTKTVGDLNGRVGNLESALSTANSEKADLAAKLATTEENLARETVGRTDAEKAVAAGEAANKSLSDNLDRVTTELTAYKKTYPALASGTVKDVRGVVSAASAKDDVYVLSVGQKDGVDIGYEFTVFRGSNYVATVVVDSVWPNLASCRVKAGTKKSDIQAGDSVSTRL